MPTPEALLRLARLVYPKITWSITDGCVHATRDLLFRFHPLHDAEQFVAVEEWMERQGRDVWHPAQVDPYVCWWGKDWPDPVCGHGNTYRAAKVSCACAVAEKGEGM